MAFVFSVAWLTLLAAALGLTLFRAMFSEHRSRMDVLMALGSITVVLITQWALLQLNLGG
jgi:hypothetical protein